jgi:hypothetical protein
MAYGANELTLTGTAQGALKRVVAEHILPKTVAAIAGATLLPLLTPMVFNSATGFWNVWSASASEVVVLTGVPTPASAGDFNTTVNGVTTAAIAYNATTAVIKQRIVEAGIAGVDDVTVVEAAGGIDANGGTLTITFGGALAGVALTITFDFTGISAGNDPVVTTPTEGVATGGLIRGFIWPDACQTAAATETLTQMLLAGTVHYDDIALPAGESAANLKIALRTNMRQFGFTIQGLDQVR